MRCLERVELLPFHTMGFFKYHESGLENPLESTPPLDQSRRDELQTFVNERLAK